MSMRWGDIGAVLSDVPTSDSHQLEQLSRADVPALVSSIKRWYPDIHVGVESCHLEEDFFYREVQLREESTERCVLAVVARDVSTQKIVGLLTLQKDTRARTVTSRLGVIHPEHRRGAFAFLGPMLLERLARSMGAGLAYYAVTLKTRHQQAIAERRGFRIVGILPAIDIDLVAPNTPRRVYEAVYAKVLAADEDVLVPPADSLTAQTARLWKQIFGTEPGTA